MKKQILLLFFISAILPSFSQDFPLKSSKWYYSNNGGTSPPNSTLKIIEYEKDTIVNDTLSCKLNNGVIFYSHNDSVFFYNTRQNRFGLLYDFSAKVGDTIELSMPPDLPTDKLSFKISIQSITEEKHQNDTLLKFQTLSLDPDFHFEDDYYMTRIGALGFLPIWGYPIPEGEYLKCYMDSSIYINYSGIPCDSVVTGFKDNTILENFYVYPNPTNKEITIYAKIADNYLVVIYDYLCKAVLESTMKENYFILDTSFLKPGLYIMKISNYNKTILNQILIVE